MLFDEEGFFENALDKDLVGFVQVLPHEAAQEAIAVHVTFFLEVQSRGRSIGAHLAALGHLAWKRATYTPFLPDVKASWGVATVS